MWLFAKPMIWLSLRTGSPSRMGAIAILWPLWMRSRAVSPKAGSPFATTSIAMTTLSSALRRITRGVFMVLVLVRHPSPRGEGRVGVSRPGRGGSATPRRSALPPHPSRALRARATFPSRGRRGSLPQAHLARQPEGELGDVCNRDQRQEEGHEPGQDRNRGALDRHLRDPRQHEQHHAERRVEEAAHQGLAHYEGRKGAGGGA